MINRVILVGRLTKDVEVRKTTAGLSVASFTVACDRRGQRNPDGSSSADFINCVAWNRQAETMAQYLHRGSLIGVDGRLQTRNYENQQGQRVYVTEVVVDNFTFLESRAQSQQAAATYNPNPMPSQPQQPVDSSFDTSFDENDTLDIASDDLPF